MPAKAGIQKTKPRRHWHTEAHCHCEERSDEAIQGRWNEPGLLRFARNDKPLLIGNPLFVFSVSLW
jgi:hypothetical protein